MSKDRKKKRLTNEGQLTIDGVELFLPIGDIFGKEYSPGEKSAQKQQRYKCKPSAETEKVTAAIASLVKITLHRQNTGKGGKIVTVVSLSKENAIDLDELAKELRKGLGCGSRVEADKVVLQGDIRERARYWFVKKGAKQVVFGN